MNAPRRASRVFSGPALLATTLLAVAFVTQAAFTCGPEFEDPCDDDRLGCDTGDEFVYLESCTLSDPLEVEVGHGESRFVSFAEAAPTVHSGSQGGQHVFVAVRVLDAALELYDKLQVTFTLAQQVECGEGSDEPDPLDPTKCLYVDAERTVVLGGDPALRTNDAGAVEEYGLLLQLGFLRSDLPARLTATVEDPCRRSGTASAAWFR